MQVRVQVASVDPDTSSYWGDTTGTCTSPNSTSSSAAGSACRSGTRGSATTSSCGCRVRLKGRADATARAEDARGILEVGIADILRSDWGGCLRVPAHLSGAATVIRLLGVERSRLHRSSVSWASQAVVAFVSRVQASWIASCILE
ncbi:hypothetical protein KY290_005402 [Solanum tuberosum]|uniref:Uncharacterized protein n=1 Tax=Solanum tuberosum TaxID=4113 RepID=A0ABQ7WE20_SOLTU|nr:hypothetical protein KY289_005798 [Solanum tuberosum]KAH0778975.1 hypothetical protein KY290_005402 [Solanum tuberosum]